MIDKLIPNMPMDPIRDAVAAALGEAYDCTRTWAAWGVGTMSQDDFQLVAEDPDRVDEIVTAALDGIKKCEISWARAGLFSLEYSPDRFGPWPWHMSDGHNNALGNTPNEAINQFMRSFMRHRVSLAPQASQDQDAWKLMPSSLGHWQEGEALAAYDASPSDAGLLDKGLTAAESREVDGGMKAVDLLIGMGWVYDGDWRPGLLDKGQEPVAYWREVDGRAIRPTLSKSDATYHRQLGGVVRPLIFGDVPPVSKSPAPQAAQGAQRAASVEPVDKALQDVCDRLNWMPGASTNPTVPTQSAQSEHGSAIDVWQRQALLLVGYLSGDNRSKLAEAKADLVRLIENLPVAAPPAQYEREAFERNFPVPSYCTFADGKYRATAYGARAEYAADHHTSLLRGWQARAALSTPPMEGDAIKALRALVSLKDEKDRLRQLHNMGHGTDYDHYHKEEPVAWEAARRALDAIDAAIASMGSKGGEQS